jgi:small multidrug resistance pump
MLAYLSLALSIMLGACGQILLKYSTGYQSNINVKLGFMNEIFAFAVCVYAASLLLYTYSLQKIPLTIAYPAVSLSYVGVAIASKHLFGTNISFIDILGFCFIATGVFLVAHSQSFG